MKYNPEHCYYTDGSFKEPEEISPGHWLREKAGYGIYNVPKNIKIAKRLHGLQNILRAEMIAIHKTLHIINTKHPNKPAHIFTDCVNVLYLLNTQIQHPSLHHNHPDKNTLASMVQMLQSRIYPTKLHKVRAHVNIEGNEKADELAKEGRDKEHKNDKHNYEHAHTTPYYYQRNEWPSMDETPDKGPIRFLAKYLKRHDLNNNLTEIAENFPNIEKWTGNRNIDNELSNNFWENPIIIDSQKTCLIKFWTGQYMGNARKQLFFGIERYPSITCPICNSTDPDTWFHVLLKCQQQHIHALIVKRHNKAVIMGN
jgi:ribonuclease HI